jgi:hypothetical protein
MNDNTAVTTTRVGTPLARRVTSGVVTAAAALGLVMTTGAAPASAATAHYSHVNCGWYLQPHAAGGFADRKVSITGLPSVTGTSSKAQLVWVLVEFVHPSESGPVAYRTGWFYTYARAGAWTRSWTSYSSGARNQTTVHDEGGAGESGYTGGELPAEDVAVRLTMSWYHGRTKVGSGYENAYAVYNANNHLVCNGGSNIY